ncbi:MAG: 2,3-bisphosphoglycerate-independent phosphoglycerate mutase [Peptococcaceae bacterium]|jgi:2,3-bisphosphoglycerate-independent phosphoglycerate mutase|nr:2,3-bisphosphoglycerate-independent phosphoglycerate mutase [Peptococcaceae bacterium]
MKYVVVIGDGMADNPVAGLGGKTPLEYAGIPVMDALAQKGELGSALTVPAGVAPGSDTAILSIFGYDPRKYYSGRSPLEAAGSGVSLSQGDVSYRCNMIALETAAKPYGQKKILSHSGGSVEGEQAIALMEYLRSEPGFAALAAANGMTFYLNPSFRHIAVQKGAVIDGLRAIPPHDHLGEVIGAYLPDGCPAAAGLLAMMELAHELLDRHPINEKRRQEGKLPANGIWFWAEGTAIGLPDFYAAWQKKGLVVSAVPLVWGIAALAGVRHATVPGATGELDTDYEGKTDAALAGLLTEGADFAVLHIEAPDECTHNGDTEGKLQAIEWLDSRCIARLTAGLERAGEDYRLLILSDHKTLTSTRGHDGDPVPYILYDSRRSQGSGLTYSEANGLKGPYVAEGYTLLERLFAPA